MNILTRSKIQKKQWLVFVLLTSAILPFQNCNRVEFAPSENTLSSLQNPDIISPPSVCDGVSCELNPLTNKPAVTTILIALGDVSNEQLVVNGASSQLIAESVVRFSSPQNNPKILLLVDYNALVEDPEDINFIKNFLLKRYSVTTMIEPILGVKLKDIESFDLIWYSNPGRPMSSRATYDSLLSYKGAVVLQGDDLSTGLGFNVSALTGLKFVSNGDMVYCDNGVGYQHDNNGGQQYRVTVDKSKIVGMQNSTIQFRYGNDIDETEIVDTNMQILASAVGGPSSCTKSRPAIIRRIK